MQNEPMTDNDFANDMSSFESMRQLMKIAHIKFDGLSDKEVARNIHDYVNNLSYIVRNDEEGWNRKQIKCANCKHPCFRDTNEADSESKEIYQTLLTQILMRIAERAGQLSIVMEDEHIDPTYRNLYYNYYSNKFFDIERRSVRISFFEDKLDYKDFSSSGKPDLDKCFIGACVIDPLHGGMIGRTLINPKWLVSEEARMRLSTFRLTIRGRKFEAKAFPFRMQDNESMCCAEITLLNLMCYYSNSYELYSTVLPSDIFALEEEYSHERVTPSRGMDYKTFTKLLARFGFYPRLYNVDEIAPAAWSGLDKDTCFRRMLHWYVDSGIPVAVNVEEKNGLKDGHSLLCIGYKYNRDRNAKVGKRLAGDLTHSSSSSIMRIHNRILDRSLLVPAKNSDEPYRLINSADLYDDYVVVDDGQIPYTIAPYDGLSRSFPNMECQNYAVPLHRGMSLDALDAYENFVEILGEEKIGLASWAEDYLVPGESVVMKMFLASNRSYKSFRVENNPYDISVLYQEAIMPHFVWVAELYRESNFFVEEDDRMAFAEMVLDATTSSANSPAESIVLMKYPGRMLLRSPGDGVFVDDSFEIERQVPELDEFKPFTENLSYVKP